MVLAPLVLHLSLAADKYIEDADRFPGWKGELPHVKTGQPGEPDTVELAFGEHGKVGMLFLEQPGTQSALKQSSRTDVSM